MQNIDLICVGKVNASYFAAGIAEYSKRLSAFCKFRIVEIPEVQIADKSASEALVQKALEKEGKAILAALRKGEYAVALCIEGKLVASENIATLLGRCAMSGNGDIAFLIGSSHGLAPEVKARADEKISLGRITLPHQLARLVLTEQIYRACSINAGLKYHK